MDDKHHWTSPWTRLTLAGLMLALGGCAIRFAKRSPWDIDQLQALSDQLEQFKTLAQLKSDEADRLRQAKELLDQRLAAEIAAKDISVGFDQRGLVVRVLDKVLFDSGKARLRSEATPVLDKVAKILNEDLPNQPIGIEGHTDNEPIRRSGWKDNWELSLARARAVLKHLVEERGVEPSRVSAIGYGEYHPIVANDTVEGRRKNRRVEIVVFPQGTATTATADQAPHGAVSYK
ncbi:MAG: flagellar motor protein MotB [Candidatus Omnitrophica bacterium]|nr:flagellar motor protein MotB [Candidatus Omnitrophota bacterium]